jgi:hypothetical protein
MDQGADPRSPEQAILMMRVIGLSLGTGVTLFAVVSWYLHQQDQPIGEFIYGSLTYNGAYAMAFLAALGALFVWRWRVAPVIEQSPRETDWRARAAALRTGLILTWALLEGGALVAEVVYLLTGHGVAGVLGVVLIWAGLALTWPRQEWLQG